MLHLSNTLVFNLWKLCYNKILKSSSYLSCSYWCWYQCCGRNVNSYHKCWWVFNKKAHEKSSSHPCFGVVIKLNYTDQLS